MNKEELFENLKLFIDKLDKYKKTGTLSFQDMDEKLRLKEVYHEIYPNVHLNFACDSCVISALNYLVPFYQREFKKFVESKAVLAPEFLEYKGEKPEAKTVKSQININKKKKR